MEVELPTSDVVLLGDLFLPSGAPQISNRTDILGTIIFVHGSGSSRYSPRNIAVARELNTLGFATLLFDLLTRKEETNREKVFDIVMLARRLIDVTRWVRTQPTLASAPIAFFGASTGAAAAIVAAPDAAVSALVSRGGRVDLAADALEKLNAPLLMIVGGSDVEVLALNRQAAARLRCENELTIIPGASHLFPEPGALTLVARAAGEWFLRHMRRSGHAVSG